MKVMVVTPSYPRFRGDYHGRFVQDICRELAGMGVRLKVLAPRTRTLEAHRSGFNVGHFPYLPSKNVEFLPEGTMKGAPLRNLVQLPPYLLSAYLHIMAERADLVHVHLAIPLGFIAALDPRSNPLVVTCHGSDCTLPCTKPVYRPFTRLALRRADRVVAVSKFIRNVAIGLGAPPENVEVVYIGVDTAKFRPPTDKANLKKEHGIPENSLVIGTLGRLIPEKRVGDLVRAAAIVSGEIDAHFLVGGDGPQRPYLEHLAGRLGAENVSFLGEIRDAVSFHQLCDIFVLPSVREGLSISLQEAMATGCVPVAVNGFGCPELIEDGENGYLFEPMDVVGMADRILRAVSKPSLGVRARETIEKGFDIKKNVCRYLEIYEKVLSTR